ncbi:ipt tig fg-gap repeat-containing protein : Integrins alpha chain protein OS=Chthoniobacter flavus Ellin428 GN=CfE428DRAFT_5229 PE=4 SV=1 [Gemmataceae bacterium]|nr:ipt tig fg-gap repeat-containing protein : Integrins alpha chain protein OS=Chthoniobacter flavus Ellin428 GN=CfE428DRAFT_5229 PE=4 SV=1 [Gemmataceae bacterium]VTT97802.1 ipt tig fg-gap repeat-containing protein : Integrins alpha chain protein OS=Chthoniobacter flavus Ellin428 GN=CfE428DRAFT_5229 PE=4 SV=1 [Gemmataceae bacterium]
MSRLGQTMARLNRLLFGADRPRPAPRRKRLSVEVLEAREVPAILWVNRGNDGFDAVYGANAAAARAVVDQAIDDWEAAIPSFNYDSPSLNNTLQVSISATPLDPGVRGAATINAIEASSRKPAIATIWLDDNGGGAGWFIDPTPADSSEFTDTIARYEGAKPGTAADLYRTALHELGHAVGIVYDKSVYGEAGTLKIMDYMTFFIPMSGPTFSNNGTFANFTLDGHIADVGGFTSNDLMNPGESLSGYVTARQHISPLNLNILRDGYGYTVDPSALRSFTFQTDEIGAFNPNVAQNKFRLRNADGSQIGITFAGAGWIPIAGDWDGDGRDEVGAFNPNRTTNQFVLRNRDGSQIGITFAGAGWIPIAGDWDGDGRDEVGAFNPNRTTNQFVLRNRDGSQIGITFAGAGWIPIAGDWDGDGRDEVGAFNPNRTTNQFVLRNRDGSQIGITFAGAGWIPIAGDWDGDGRDEVGAFNPNLSSNQFRLRSASGTVTPITFAGSGWTPITGNWNF